MRSSGYFLRKPGTTTRPMRTERGLFPIQMCMRGLISSHIQEPVSDDYRVDEEECANPFDEGSVSAPAIPNQFKAVSNCR